jgi:diacylglycerol kinase family enzyme
MTDDEHAGGNGDERGLHPVADPGSSDQFSSPSIGVRLGAAVTILVMGVTLALVIGYTLRNIAYLFLAFCAVSLGISSVWVALTNRRWRWVAVLVAVLLLIGAIASLWAAGDGILALVGIVVGIVLSSSLGSMVLHLQMTPARPSGHPVSSARHPVLLMNPRSGGGKVARYDLPSECEHRGIEAVVLAPGDDLRQLAELAADAGADVLGMAGGDGSQALVASVAAAHGLGYVCVPAGTRNHLALDLGVDRNDVTAALDAFGPAREFRIDLATVNGQVFVNNVSLGLYATMVSSDSYRDQKARTAAQTIEERLAPGAEPFDLHLDGPTGSIDGPQIVEISNNSYDLTTFGGFATRGRMDGGELGVVTVRIDSPLAFQRLAALEMAGHPERFPGFNAWATPTVSVHSDSAVPAGIDGENCQLDPPVRFATLPGALRVRVAHGYPGMARVTRPAPLRASTVVGLWTVVRGHSIEGSRP